MKRAIAFAILSLIFAHLWAEKNYDMEKSAYYLELPAEPYSLRPDKDEKTLRTFSDEARKMWDDPVLQESIELGIKNNRMGDFFIDFRTKNGRPAKVENVKITMLKHEFLFGAQAFNVKGFGVKKGIGTGQPFVRDPNVSDADVERMNDLYEKEFANLFNFATLPFYWAASEPESGVYRFAKDSEPIFRRPPPDLVLEFCKKYDITPKGHCLSWQIPQWSKPKWVPIDKREFEKYMCRYIKNVGEYYDGAIDFWDVSNEITDERAFGNPWTTPHNPHWFMPDDYALTAFKEAERVFNTSTKFISNYTTPVWQRVATYRQYSSDWLATSHLIKSGAKVDIVGLQLHFFDDHDRQHLFSGQEWGPYWMLSVLDTLGQFNRPIHITELTFPCMQDEEFGESNQAFITENFYKLWFSHKDVEAITYWHFVDNVNGGEDKFRSGFLRQDFSRKPAYDILDNLINKQWRTDLEYKDIDGMAHFRAFYGKYKITYTYDGKERTTEVNLTKYSPQAPRIFVDR